VSKIALFSDEPIVTITVPVRVLPQLMALLAVAATPAAQRPEVETTAAETASPRLRKTLPPIVRQLPARKAG
jgi:hypothetical protein